MQATKTQKRNLAKVHNIEVKTVDKELKALIRKLKSFEADLSKISDLNRNRPGMQVADMVEAYQYDTRDYLDCARDQKTAEARNAAGLARIRQANTATLRRVLDYAAIVGVDVR